MDQATREGRPAVSAAGDETVGEQNSPEELRREIEQTREDLGDTVQALAEKSDVKAQARDRIAAVKDTAQEKKDDFVFNAKRATPDSARGRSAGRLENPGRTSAIHRWRGVRGRLAGRLASR